MPGGGATALSGGRAAGLWMPGRPGKAAVFKEGAGLATLRAVSVLMISTMVRLKGRDFGDVGEGPVDDGQWRAEAGRPSRSARPRPGSALSRARARRISVRADIEQGLFGRPELFKCGGWGLLARPSASAS
jgi:hypothetical protein